MKRKELEALLVSTIEDIKSVESIDELEINEDQRICYEESLVKSPNIETSSMREKNDDDYYKNNDLPISTILDFLTDEAGELEIAKKQKTIK
jgi:hypothetical protein